MIPHAFKMWLTSITNSVHTAGVDLPLPVSDVFAVLLKSFGQKVTVMRPCAALLHHHVVPSAEMFGYFARLSRYTRKPVLLRTMVPLLRIIVRNALGHHRALNPAYANVRFVPQFLRPM